MGRTLKHYDEFRKAKKTTNMTVDADDISSVQSNVSPPLRIAIYCNEYGNAWWPRYWQRHTILNYMCKLRKI